MGHFKLKNKVLLSSLTENDIIPESDFSTLTPDGYFIQLEYHKEETPDRFYTINPGLHRFKEINQEIVLVANELVNDNVLMDLMKTKEVADKIDDFFTNIQVYYDHGIDVPKRGCLIYGQAGSGKSTVISEVCKKYLEQGTVAVIYWHTERFSASDIRDFFKSAKYEGVDKLILVAEDLGGVEVDQVRMKSDPGLLSLLDNKERAFTIPTMIIATTNYPEIFLENLMNRPDRFDDKIEIGKPDSESRKKLLKFYSRKEVSEEELNLIASSKCKDLTPAHIRELVIRCAIRRKNLIQGIEEILAEIEKFNKAFSNKNGMGMGVQ